MKDRIGYPEGTNWPLISAVQPGIKNIIIYKSIKKCKISIIILNVKIRKKIINCLSYSFHKRPRLLHTLNANLWVTVRLKSELKFGVRPSDLVYR